MFGLTMEKISKIVQGKLLGGQGSREPAGASIDTRQLKAGDLFFAIKGAKADGHEFLREARSKGAAGAVVQYRPACFAEEDFPLIMVDDTIRALQQVALAMRKQFGGPVIAITGSTGKTSTKDMLWSVLNERWCVLKNPGNYNNELGLPLALLALTKEHQAVILEMGMRGLGEIDFLARLSEPSYGVITNIGHTHQELLGSQERIAQAKAELLSHLPHHGGVVLNTGDRALLKPWLSNIRSQVLWVGLDSPADLWASCISHVSGEAAGMAGTAFTINSRRSEKCEVKLPLPGRHNVLNALLAVGVARQLGWEWQEIKSGLEKVKLTAMRLEFKEIPGRDILVIDDAYNANPASMMAAFEVMKASAAGKRIVAVLGDMYELGDYEEEGHRLVGQKAKEMNAAYLITVGHLASLIALGAKEAGMAADKIRSCQNNQEAVSYLKDILQPGDIVLVKGSRGVKMEEIIAGLLK